MELPCKGNSVELECANHFTSNFRYIKFKLLANIADLT